MNIKQQFSRIKEKVKKIEWKRMIATKSFITVGCIMLVCVAVLVSSLASTPDTNTQTEDVYINKVGTSCNGTRGCIR